MLPSPSWSSTMKVKVLQSPAMMGDALSKIHVQCYVPKDCVSVTMTNQLFNALWGGNPTLRIIWNGRVYLVVKYRDYVLNRGDM